MILKKQLSTKDRFDTSLNEDWGQVTYNLLRSLIPTLTGISTKVIDSPQSILRSGLQKKGWKLCYVSTVSVTIIFAVNRVGEPSSNSG